MMMVMVMMMMMMTMMMMMGTVCSSNRGATGINYKHHKKFPRGRHEVLCTLKLTKSPSV